MVQGKIQLNSKPRFAEVVIGDNEINEKVNDMFEQQHNYIILVCLLKLYV